MPACPICHNRQKKWRSSQFLAIRSCQHCGHLTADHLSSKFGSALDYHLQYNQDSYLDSLSATRRRQAQTLGLKIKRMGADKQGLVDIGCGRAHFLHWCKQQGFLKIAGIDTSPLAIEALRNEDIQGLVVQPGQKEIRLSFAPAFVTFLDVIEHFESEGFKAGLQDILGNFQQRNYLILKVPTRNGFLFGLAKLLASCGISGPLNSLFQVGTSPPHFHYFSDKSARQLMNELGFDIIEFWKDPDFEKEGLGERMNLRGFLLNSVNIGGNVLFRIIQFFNLGDSIVVIGKRRVV